MYTNQFDNFTVFFQKESLNLGEKSYPLGQLTVDVMNLDPKIFDELDRRAKAFQTAFTTFWMADTEETAVAAQEKLNAFMDTVEMLPGYRDMGLDKTTIRNFVFILHDDEDKNAIVHDPSSEPYTMLQRTLRQINEFSNLLFNFQQQTLHMMYLYLEPLKGRKAEDYAKAYLRYFRDISSFGGFFEEYREFHQAYESEVEFLPMEDEKDESKIIIAEKMTFRELSQLLYVDFYRGLSCGNAPKVCENCGTVFLQTKGYRTYFCNNIAPGETTKTCRRVGAYRKAAHPDELRPALAEYRRAYERLKKQMHRKKMSRDEWNSKVVLARQILEESDRGELSDAEMHARFEEI